MNNLFKSNSRFDVLNDEKKEPKKEMPRQRDSSFKKTAKMEEIKTTEIKTNGFSEKNSIKLDDLFSFPDLIADKKELIHPEEEDKKSFMDIVQIQKKEKEVEDLEQLPKGWIMLKKGKPSYTKEQSCEMEIDSNRVFNRLVESYEKWKAEYIENWGIDEYEREYRFPNYDYHSFDLWDSENEYEFGEESDDYE